VVVTPGSGWPGDPAAPSTPVAQSVAAVLDLSRTSPNLAELDARISVCRACPRLVEWREEVAQHKRASFASETYWGRPIPGWGPADARIVVVGLAPAAHGGNRTGRVFTGDRSGDWLFASLYRTGFARLPTSTHAGDGQALIDVRMLAAVRCAPPQNAPSPRERDTCRPWLERELAMMRPNLRVVVALGGFAWNALWPTLAAVGYQPPAPRPRFGHLAEITTAAGLHVIASFHPSQQNTFTGKLTEPMLDAVFDRARSMLG
jgi:uracil-DNA glycosylase family 4